MKLYLYCIFFLIFTHFGVTAQNGNAYYIKKAKGKDTISSLVDKASINNNTKSELSTIDKTLSDFQYILRFNLDFAEYDKVKNIDDNSFKSKFASAFSGFSGKVYFNRASKLIITSSDITGKVFLVKKSSDDIIWKLTKEKVIINGLTCYKANSTIFEEGRRGTKEIGVVAWYAPEINIPYGPDGYGGLPGLIIQLEKGNIVTSLKKIELFEKKIVIDIPKKGNFILEKDYNEYIKNLVLNRNKN